MKAEGEVRPFSEFREAGLLWAVNRYVLHPRGYALAFQFEKRDGVPVGDPLGWSIEGDGSETWHFPEAMDDEGMAAFERLLRPPAEPDVVQHVPEMETTLHGREDPGVSSDVPALYVAAAIAGLVLLVLIVVAVLSVVVS